MYGEVGRLIVVLYIYDNTSCPATVYWLFDITARYPLAIDVLAINTSISTGYSVQFFPLDTQNVYDHDV